MARQLIVQNRPGKMVGVHLDLAVWRDPWMGASWGYGLAFAGIVGHVGSQSERSRSYSCRRWAANPAWIRRATRRRRQLGAWRAPRDPGLPTRLSRERAVSTLSQILVIAG